MTAMPEAVAILRAAYPRQDFPDATVALYVRYLADRDSAGVVRAVDRLIRRSRFLPSIAEILEEEAEERLALPSAEEAWVLASGESGELPGPVRDALNDVGGRWALRTSEVPGATRKHFIDAYAARRREAIRVDTGAAPRPELEGHRVLDELPAGR